MPNRAPGGVELITESTALVLALALVPCAPAEVYFPCWKALGGGRSHGPGMNVTSSPSPWRSPYAGGGGYRGGGDRPYVARHVAPFRGRRVGQDYVSDSHALRRTLATFSRGGSRYVGYAGRLWSVSHTSAARVGLSSRAIRNLCPVARKNQVLPKQDSGQCSGVLPAHVGRMRTDSIGFHCASCSAAHGLPQGLAIR